MASYWGFRSFLVCSAIAGSICMGSIAEAAVAISSLKNTGVDSGGTKLSHGAADTDYSVRYNSFTGAVTQTNFATVLSGAGSAATPLAFTNDSVFPLSNAWIKNSSSAASAWIVPSIGSGGLNHAPGTYFFSTTFDLTGLIASTASITGRWASDNAAQIFLNGIATGLSSPAFSSWSNFTLSNPAWFVNGVNTLTFVVNNASGASGNPTGLRVEMSGTAEVPEPASIAFWGLGALGVVCLRRRK